MDQPVLREQYSTNKEPRAHTHALNGNRTLDHSVRAAEGETSRASEATAAVIRRQNYYYYYYYY
jgi:hypothetical protein